MEELKKIFEERDSIFEEQTFKIFDLIKATLVSVTVFLKEIDSLVDSGIIVWEDVNLVDDLAILVGMLKFDPGTEIQSDGNKLLITEANKEYFQRVIHMSLPYDLVISSDEEAILDFLYDLYSKEQDAEVKATGEEPEFDLTKLTNEQLESLIYYDNIKDKN